MWFSNKFKAVPQWLQPADIRYKLTPYHSKPAHLYGPPKIHKPDIPLRLIVVSLGFPCYALAGFLHKILSPLVAKSESFLKNLGHFMQLWKSVALMLLVFSLMYQLMKPYKSSEISSIMMTHWQNSLPCRSSKYLPTHLRTETDQLPKGCVL
jgi:hypothetical protein